MSESQSILALCKIQSELISELSDQIYDNPYLERKVSEVQDMFENYDFSESLREIKRKAVWDILNHADEVAESENDWIRIVGWRALELERSE